jgi:RimJ/RimL family protein N-acetyltransferase
MYSPITDQSGLHAPNLFRMFGMTIESRLRLVEESDLQFLSDIRQDPDVIDNLGSFVLLNDYLQQQWFRRTQDHPRQKYLIFEILDGADWLRAGLARITDIDTVNRSASVGGDIHKDFRGKKLSTEMYKHIFRICFDYFNLHRIWMVVLDQNTRAYSLYQKIGFVEEGRQKDAILRKGKYHDFVMMSYISPYDA